MYSQLLGKKVVELGGILVKDVMVHLIPKWDMARYSIAVEVKNELLITVVNSGLDWVDTVTIQVKGRNPLKLYRWDVGDLRY